MAAPIKRLLVHKATLSGTPTRTVPTGKTESVWTYPNKVVGVITNVQAMRGRDRLTNAGIEEVATHRMWFEPGVSIAVNDIVKATSARGTSTSDTYELSDFSPALQKLAETCP